MNSTFTSRIIVPNMSGSLTPVLLLVLQLPGRNPNSLQAPIHRPPRQQYPYGSLNDDTPSESYARPYHSCQQEEANCGGPACFYTLVPRSRGFRSQSIDGLFHRSDVRLSDECMLSTPYESIPTKFRSG